MAESSGPAALKLNQRSLAFHATCDAAAHNAGFLYKKGGRHAAHRRRWSVPRGTMLFCFRDGASGEPVEGCTVQLVEAAEEFAFAVRFAGARARTYVLAAEEPGRHGGLGERAVAGQLRRPAAGGARAGAPAGGRARRRPTPAQGGRLCHLERGDPQRHRPQPPAQPRDPATAASPAGLGTQRASRLGLPRPAAGVVRAGAQGAEDPVAPQPGPALRIGLRAGTKGKEVKGSPEVSTGPGSGATPAPGPAVTGPALRHGDLALRAVTVGLSPEVPAWSALRDSGSEKMLGSEGCFGTSVIQRKPSREEAIVPDPQENPGHG